MATKGERRRKAPPGQNSSPGFEASPYSPAGEVQGFARLADGLLRSGRRTQWARRIAVSIAVLFLVLLITAALAGSG